MRAGAREPRDPKGNADEISERHNYEEGGGAKQEFLKNHTFRSLGRSPDLRLEIPHFSLYSLHLHDPRHNNRLETHSPRLRRMFMKRHWLVAVAAVAVVPAVASAQMPRPAEAG